LLLLATNLKSEKLKQPTDWFVLSYVFVLRKRRLWLISSFSVFVVRISDDEKWAGKNS
jgi:hypothetical protein